MKQQYPAGVRTGAIATFESRSGNGVITCLTQLAETGGIVTSCEVRTFHQSLDLVQTALDFSSTGNFHFVDIIS